MKTKWQALIVALGVGALSLAGCAGKIIVTKVPEADASNSQQLDGVLYALPRTVVKVAVPIERVQFKKGIYSQYAGLFFPDASKGEDFVKPEDDKKTKYSIGKPVFSTIGEPDLSKLYYVKLTGKGPVDRTASLDYTEQGTVSGVQASAENYTTDIILSALSAASGLATRIAYSSASTSVPAAFAPEHCPGSSSPSEDAKVHMFFSNAEEVFFNYCELTGQPNKAEVQQAVAAASSNENAPLSKALKAYIDIRRLTNNRRDLIIQVKSVPLPSLDLMIKEIDALVSREIAAFFTGLAKKDTWTPTFELRPATLNGSLKDLLKFDQANGVCLVEPLHAQDDPTDEFAKVIVCQSTTAKILRIRFALDGGPQIFQRVQTVFTQDGERSFRYLIPAATLVTLEMADPAAAANATGSAVKGGKAVIMVGQFGAEVSLPASSGGRSLNYALKFFEATGAMKSFSLTSKTAMQAAAVNSVSSSANAILDAKNKQEQAAADKADELNKLERQRKILEDKAKILELCAQLKISCQ